MFLSILNITLKGRRQKIHLTLSPLKIVILNTKFKFHF